LTAPLGSSCASLPEAGRRRVNASRLKFVRRSILCNILVMTRTVPSGCHHLPGEAAGPSWRGRWCRRAECRRPAFDFERTHRQKWAKHGVHRVRACSGGATNPMLLLGFCSWGNSPRQQDPFCYPVELHQEMLLSRLSCHQLFAGEGRKGEGDGHSYVPSFMGALANLAA